MKLKEGNYIAQAIDNNTGYFGTCTISNYDGAIRTVKYYRSIGYNAKVFSESEYDDKLKENCNMRNEQIKMQRSEIYV